MDFKIKMLPALFLTGLLVSCNTFPASAEKSEKKSEKKETVPVKQEKSLPDSSVKQENALYYGWGKGLYYSLADKG